MRLAGKTAVITGAGSGIGRATAEKCAREGATVIVTDVDVSGGNESVDRIEKQGGDAEFRELDVTDYDAVATILREVDEEHDGLDLLHNNAGILGPVGKLTEMTHEERDRMIDINVNGVWNGCHAAIPLMKNSGGGSIVNTSSVSGYLASDDATTYCLTKAAVLNFTRAVAYEYGNDNIRVNSVCPGMTETAMIEKFYNQLEDDPIAARERFLEAFPLDRLGRPEDIADGVVFLLSDEADWITGHALTIDGGFSLH